MRGFVDHGIAEKVRAAGGQLFALTSEPQRLATQAQDEWQLDFEVMGDPHHEISGTCSARGWLQLHVAEAFDWVHRGHWWQRNREWKAEHPKGYFQPGVLALSRTGRVLYRWRSVPSLHTMGGASRRPAMGPVLEQIERARRDGPEAGDAVREDDPVLDRRTPPYLPFLMLLVANGWFLRVKPMIDEPGAPALKFRILFALLRLVIFIAAWIVALVYLPTIPVVLVFAGWLLWMQRERKYIRQQFPKP